jgi:protein ImuB
MTNVPSYEDLTPSIPDVVASEAVPQLALFLRGVTAAPLQRCPAPESEAAPLKRCPTRVAAAASRPLPLYACVRIAGGDAGALIALAREFSPRVMRCSPHELLIDVAGLGRLIGPPAAIAREVARAARDARLDARVAVAATQTAARLLTRGTPSDIAVADTGVARAVAPLPVTLLQDLDVVPEGMPVRDRLRPFETFERWGIATLGDLAALPAAGLSSRLGRRGAALQRLACALDPRPFVPDADSPRYQERLELEWPIEGLEPLSFVLARLLEPLSASLERADRGAAAVHLDLRLTDRSTHARLLQLPAAMRDARVLRTLLLLDLESHPPSAAIDIVAVEADPAPARITQFSLLERALPSPETISTLMARLSALVGETRCGSAALVDTHRPGAFEMTSFVGPEGFALRACANATAGHGGTERANGAERPASGRSGVSVAGCGGPRQQANVLRRQRMPPAIRVRIAGGRPVHVTGARRGLPSGVVTQAAGPWRTSGHWWSSQRTAQPWDRDEWDVALADGSMCRIFHDRALDRWFLDGVYD